MQGFKPGAKPADKQKGGKIKGPGSGTSDSIKADIPKGSYIMPADSTQQIGPKALGELGEPVPVNVSNGEYQMPPEQVHAVGVQALNQMRDATHTPAPAGFKPQNDGLYFADGGSPAEEERRRLPGNLLAVTYGDMTGRPSAGMAPRPQQPAVMPAVSYNDMQRAPTRPQPSAPSPSGAINTATPPRPSAPVAAQPPAQAAGFGPATEQAPQGAPVSFSSMQREPNVPRTGQPRQMPQGEPVGASGIADGLQAVGQRAAAGIKGAADQAAQAGRGFMAGGQAMTDQAATAAGSAVDAASGALTYLNRGDPVRDAANAIGGFFSRSAQQARGASYGGQPESAAAPQPVAAPPATTPPPATPSTPEGDPQAAPEAARPAPAATTPTQQPMQGPALGMRVSPTSAPEINRIDNAPGLKSPLFTNLPTGEAISGMQGGTVNTVPALKAQAATQQAPQPAGFQPYQQQRPAGGVIGNSDQSRREREALIRAASTPYRGAQSGQLTANQLRTLAGLQEGDQRAATEAANQQAATERAAMQEAGANARALSRDEIDRRSADTESLLKGFEARGLERVEKLYAAYENAKTPEERAAAAEQLRALSGKEAPNRFTVVPGGQELSPQGMPYTRPSMVLNNQTGQLVDLGAPDAKPSPPDNHIAALKKNPAQAAQFDAIYGPGAAARYLGVN